MAPFDTQHYITFWIPLNPVPSANKGGTGLVFCSKSHSDFALPYWNPNVQGSEWNRLEHRYPERIVDYMPMNLGDVTVHSGWTLHSSNGNHNNIERNNGDRMALAITFVDGSAEIRPDALDVGDNEDQMSYRDWIHQVPARKPFRHELVPIVWPPEP